MTISGFKPPLETFLPYFLFSHLCYCEPNMNQSTSVCIQLMFSHAKLKPALSLLYEESHVRKFSILTPIPHGHHRHKSHNTDIPRTHHGHTMHTPHISHTLNLWKTLLVVECDWSVTSVQNRFSKTYINNVFNYLKSYSSGTEYNLFLP